MADTRPLCRYFANNCCRKGDSCSFSHDRNARQDLTCRFYNQGYCAYGTNCRYDHVRTSVNSAGNAPPLVEEKKLGNTHNADNTDNKIGHGELEELKPHNHKNNPSYASALGTQPSYPQDFKEELLCPYNEEGICPHPECQFIHGDLCEFCGRACLNPFSEEQRKEHKRQCVAEHEKAMEDAFAEARTVDKNCGICMENIWEKNGRFGILNNCRHCFCLDCIRRWRKSQQFEHKTTRSCPECRTHSDFVIPASRWVEDQNEKERLIELYRQNTSKKCFYRHENADGTIARCDSPNTISRRSRHRAPHLVEYIIDESVYWSSDDEPSEAEYLAEILSLRNVGLYDDW
ncbi:hypothetical protein QR680_003478 [Steinernema hermaphroditum]|uniref:RING-type E3 ubiquitin transferase n=1 Tax=Steinernema hermaphroditum TaxID=289476 RepID=A0AA39H6Z5_9BILA|nr:hypothetical protein QR680_003478 [Steinernema hermaphroditum]